MKRHGNLWDKIVNKDNLYNAYLKARKGKGWQRKVRVVDKNPDKYINELYNILRDGKYQTAKYKTKIIFEPKMRTIYILPFYPDRIVHHAIMNVLEPIWDGLFMNHSYACRKNKGQHKASTYCMSLVRKYKYVLKCDISKFYPSVNHAILKKIIRHKIKDKKVLALLDTIIDSTDTETNVPIGNYLSQWFGNLYLNKMDMELKHKYHVKALVRYSDDFLIFSNDKKELHFLAFVVQHFLKDELGMRLSKCNIFPTSQGVDFLGYRHFPQGYILVRKSTAKRIKRRMKGLIWEYKHHRITKIQALSKIASAEGWMKHATTHNLAVSLKINELKECIKNERYSEAS